MLLWHLPPRMRQCLKNVPSLTTPWSLKSTIAIAWPQPGSVSRSGRCRFLITTQALNNGGDSVSVLLISQDFRRGLYQARSPSGINQRSFIEVKGPNSHLEKTGLTPLQSIKLL